MEIHNPILSKPLARNNLLSLFFTLRKKSPQERFLRGRLGGNFLNPLFGDPFPFKRGHFFIIGPSTQYSFRFAVFGESMGPTLWNTISSTLRISIGLSKDDPKMILTKKSREKVAKKPNYDKCKKHDVKIVKMI